MKFIITKLKWCYDRGLSLWEQAYFNVYKPNARKLREVFTNHIKPVELWIKDLSSEVYQYAFINLGGAFKSFFQELDKNPKFQKKSKHDSSTINQFQNSTSVRP
ncbi:MAG: hypothetical protein F6K23_29605 [Okeania sp. SIO2C9]|uniref:hypothetical protein n=1 Tax=Okeania sp. SIO2C9 TaxID=2607791 RepID=UPI0013BFA9D6|nr:hypothetical protein [Okeania sp. SIO2C9]NEQ76814.1 hypothetical protein [Okeania sp. SIO2C9]